MSRHRYSRDPARETQQSLTFDLFRDHITRELAHGENHILTTEEYKTVDKDGPTHLIIRLRNVGEGNIKLFSGVKAFREGSELKETTNPASGARTYTAYIPWRDPDNSKYDDRRRDSKHSRLGYPKPSINRLYGYAALFAGVCAVASWTTTAADWAFITNRLVA